MRYSEMSGIEGPTKVRLWLDPGKFLAAHPHFGAELWANAQRFQPDVRQHFIDGT